MAHCEKTFPLCFGGSRFDGSTATFDGHGERVHDHFFGQSSFATYALANERNVKVSRDVPLELLNPLACGIQTGAGAVLRFDANELAIRNCMVLFSGDTIGALTPLLAHTPAVRPFSLSEYKAKKLEEIHVLF